jgi:Na+/proline symporter
MSTLDFVVIGLYIVGLITVGTVFARRMSSMKEMFAAGGQSPWWLSGLSGFMTMFSAGTFVVWGGISFRYGMVGVSICMMLGISALLVGWLLAGVWKQLGVDSAAEFLELRFGRSIVQFSMWLQGTLGIFSMGGAVYALSVLVCALIPLPDGHLLADPATGKLSITITSLGICLIVVVVCFVGGLWAVLMTDMLQFIILSVAVLLVVPLLFTRVGGISEFVAKAPDGFFSPVNGDFTWWFLAGWIVIHFFKIGGEWAFVQRFTCVPSPRDARKAAWIFGVMYLISPIIWMLPPMLYRVIDPSAPHEQAYILACQSVLPAGLLGLMVVAMSSATASTATTVLNVYAGAFTEEFYRRLFRPDAGDKELVLVGRLITVLLGVVVAAGALLIPQLGSYTGWILTTTGLLTGPLLLPSIWGLFSKKIGLRAAWLVTVLSGVLGLVAKFGLEKGGWFDGIAALSALTTAAQWNPRLTEILIGTSLPLALLLAFELLGRQTAPGWTRIEERRRLQREAPPVLASDLPARLCGWSIGVLGCLIAAMALIGSRDTVTLGIFAGFLVVLAGLILFLSRPKSH